MATLVFGSITLPDGAVTFEVDYNANNRRIQTGRCVHTGQSDVHIEVSDLDTGEVLFNYTLLTGTTTFNVSNRQLVLTPEGTLELPYGYTIAFPWIV